MNFATKMQIFTLIRTNVDAFHYNGVIRFCAQITKTGCRTPGIPQTMENTIETGMKIQQLC